MNFLKEMLEISPQEVDGRPYYYPSSKISDFIVLVAYSKEHNSGYVRVFTPFIPKSASECVYELRWDKSSIQIVKDALNDLNLKDRIEHTAKSSSNPSEIRDKLSQIASESGRF